MLEKIISIANVGRFLNSAAQPNPMFARHTFVFGPNGYGKTTLCAVLRSLERDEPQHLLGRRSLGAAAEPSASLLWNGAPRMFHEGAWPGGEPRLSIFDGTFVAENVHSGDVIDIANRRNLYRVIVGRNGVGLAREEQRLADVGRGIQQRLALAERALEGVADGVELRAFAALKEPPNLAGDLNEARAALAAQRQADAIQTRPALEAVVLPELPDGLVEALQQTIDGIDADVETLVDRHIHAHNMLDGGEAWLASGAGFEAGDDCPFCGRDGANELDLIKAFRALFGERYNQLRAAIANLRERAEAFFGPASFLELRSIAVANLSAREFWAHHCDLAQELPTLSHLRANYAELLDRLFDVLDSKAARPLDVVDWSDRVAEIELRLRQIQQDISEYNEAAARSNIAIEAKRAQTAASDVGAAQSALANLERVQRRHANPGRTLCATWQAVAAEKQANIAAKAAVRARLDEHCAQVVQPYQARINHFLGLFNAGFSIVDVGHAYPGGVATSNYRLRINNVVVALGDARTADHEPSFKNTLSSGDRTTLALAFFLAELERENDLAGRVVVFGDPFNSQDSFRRRNTIHEIMAVAGAGSQIVVLSHDANFLRSLWIKSPPAERASLQLIFHEATGTKLTAFDLEGACQGRAQTELDDLLAYRRANVGQPRDVIKKLRVVLETHFRSMFPGAFDPADNLGVILRKIRDGGEGHPAAPWYDQLNRINDYTQDYHHGEDPRGMAEPPLDATELGGYVGETLRIANAVVG